jgi:hypothetical protein
VIAPRTDGCKDGVIVNRRCPECGHCDQVVTTAFAAAVCETPRSRVTCSIHALADALADGARSGLRIAL